MNKTLGVLGGMGPQATIDFMQKVLDLTDASCDQQHIRVIADSHPQIPHRTQAILHGGQSPAPKMQHSLDTLVKAGAQCIAMPCVTAHYFLGQLQVPPSVEFLRMPELTARACAQRFPKGVAGILSTSGTASSGVMSKVFEQHGLGFIVPQPQDQQLMDELITGVKAGDNMGEIVSRFSGLTSRLLERGAHYFVLACTEIPIIVQAHDFAHPYADPTTELAKAAVAACG